MAVMERHQQMAGTTALAEPAMRLERASDGSILLRPEAAIGPYPDRLGHHLAHWARATPDQIFLAERDAGGAWRKVTYGQAFEQVEGLARGLVALKLDGSRPLALLGDNGVNNGLLSLAAMQVGIPMLPVSPAYSLMSSDYSKLRHVMAMMDPAAIHVPDPVRFAGALAHIPADAVVIADTPGDGVLAFDAVMRTETDSAYDARVSAVGPDTVAKILLTSGSTGMPKGVVNSQRMLGANGASVDAVWPFLAAKPPVIVDWLPWSHTFGTNFNLTMILRNGGTMYIDAGRPAPGRFADSLKNLAEIQPTLLFNVPRGFDMLVTALEQDPELSRRVLERVELVFYAGSALPKPCFERLSNLIEQTRGNRMPIMSALGSTETSPVATLSHWLDTVPGCVGLPVPGVEIKLVPAAGKLEMRVRGPNVTPGYYRNPEATAAAFDEEGFFRLGDAVRFVDPDDPNRGLLFDGRLSENFKLSTGTWVDVGNLRLAMIAACAPALQDCVIAGHDRDEIGLLVFPDLPACRAMAGLPGDAPAAAVIVSAAVHRHFAGSIARFNAEQRGSSRRIGRLLLLDEPPSIDGGEITDKGYINQRGVLSRRAALVEALYDPQAARDLPGYLEPAEGVTLG